MRGQARADVDIDPYRFARFDDVQIDDVESAVERAENGAIAPASAIRRIHGRGASDQRDTRNRASDFHALYASCRCLQPRGRRTRARTAC